jgi:hypothetical protein
MNEKNSRLLKDSSRQCASRLKALNVGYWGRIVTHKRKV